MLSAGTNIKTRTMAEMTPDQWDQVLAINATGAYNCMYSVLPQMRSRGDGLRRREFGTAAEFRAYNFIRSIDFTRKPTGNTAIGNAGS